MRPVATRIARLGKGGVMLRVEEYASTRTSTVVTVAGDADPAGTHRLSRLPVIRHIRQLTGEPGTGFERPL